MSRHRGHGHVELRRVIPAPIERVYAAWTDPDTMSRWLSPTGRAEVEADVRVGGDLTVTMVGDDMRIEHRGRYLHLDPPHRVSFTWRSPHTGDEETVVTVLLEARDEGTLLVLNHERLPGRSAPSHRDGWGSILDRLEEQILGPAPRAEAGL